MSFLLLFLSCFALTDSLKSKVPLFGWEWGPVGGQLFCLFSLTDLHVHSFSMKVVIVSSDL